MERALFSLLALASAFVPTTIASNPFSSNVVALNPRNFKQLVDSPHVWFVNVCRQSVRCGERWARGARGWCGSHHGVCEGRRPGGDGGGEAIVRRSGGDGGGGRRMW